MRFSGGSSVRRFAGSLVLAGKIFREEKSSELTELTRRKVNRVDWVAALRITPRAALCRRVGGPPALDAA